MAPKRKPERSGGPSAKARKRSDSSNAATEAAKDGDSDSDDSVGEPLSVTRAGTFFRVNTSKHKLRPLAPKALAKLPQGTRVVCFGQGEGPTPDTLISVELDGKVEQAAIVNLGVMASENGKNWPITRHRLQWQPSKRRWDWIAVREQEAEMDNAGPVEAEDQSVYIALMPKTITEEEMRRWNDGLGDPFDMS